MKGNKVASRYAQALLDLAVEQNALDRVYADMVEFASIYSESKELRTLLDSPVVPGKKKLDVLTALFGGKMDKMSTSFMNLVVKHSREGLLGEVAAAFTELYKAHKNILDVFVT